MSIFAVYNIKRGVGKTAASVNLAYLSSLQGGRTLLCDMDPQGSASYYFRIRPADTFSGKKLLKGGRHIEKNIRGTDYENLDMLPADFSYRNIDIALDDCKKSHHRLAKVLHPLEDDYERIFLDCPPNITLLSENIFHAADHILCRSSPPPCPCSPCGSCSIFSTRPVWAAPSCSSSSPWPRSGRRCTWRPCRP